MSKKEVKSSDAETVVIACLESVMNEMDAMTDKEREEDRAAVYRLARIYFGDAIVEPDGELVRTLWFFVRGLIKGMEITAAEESVSA